MLQNDIGSYVSMVVVHGIYTMHNKFSNFLYFASLCAHLCAMSNIQVSLFLESFVIESTHLQLLREGLYDVSF